MKARFPGAQARLVALMLVTLVGVLAALWAWELASRYRWAHETLDGLTPRYARLAGILEAGIFIRARGREANEGLLALAYGPDVEVPRIGTDLQQRIRRLAEEVGVRVSGSQIQPVREHDGFLVVGVTATMDGEIGEVAEFLSRIENENPPLIAEKFLVQAPRAVRRGEIATRVSVQITIGALRLMP